MNGNSSPYGPTRQGVEPSTKWQHLISFGDAAGWFALIRNWTVLESLNMKALRKNIY